MILKIRSRFLLNKIEYLFFNYNYKNLTNNLKKMSIFTQSLDPITGCTVWEEKDPDYDYHQEVARSAFADMLHDEERNQKYYAALRKAVEKIHSQGLQANVLDIGTGTGLLSMMAATCGADTVTACEAFRPMAECAEKVIKRNNLESRIKLIKKKSVDIKVGDDGDMKQKANILVTEIFDTELIGEGALSTLQHAHQQLLEKNCIVIPCKATVWAQVVESNLVKKWNRINPIKDPMTGETLLKAPDSVNNCPGSSAVHDIQLSQLPHESFTALLNSQPIFTFDWSGTKPIIFDESNVINSHAIASGTAHAIFMWWELMMDEKETIKLSCAPVWEHPERQLTINKELSMINLADKIPWRDHWMQAIYYLPKEMSIELNQKVALIGCHDEYSFWFNLDETLDPKKDLYECPVCTCSLHLAYSRTRIGQLNNEERNNRYINVLRKHITEDTECLCISDGCLIGLMTAVLGAKKLVIYEPNSISRKTIESFIKCNNLIDKVNIIENIDKFCWTQESNRLVVGDPYYLNSIFPWDNFRFWHLLSTYASNVPSIPMAVRIRGVIVEFKDLHKIRAPVEVCEGFELLDFDKLVLKSSNISDRPVEAHPLWEYPNRALSEPFDIAVYKINEEFNSASQVTYSGQTALLESGLCNGIVLWTDWYLDSETIITTGPLGSIIHGEKITWDMYNRQGVYLLHKVQHVTKQNILTWSFKYRCNNNHYFDFKFDIK